MKLALFVPALAVSSVAFAQLTGPAILSRGEAPAAMVGPKISFRPYLEVEAIYGTGLAGIAITEQGRLAANDSAGLRTVWGISGTHRTRRTLIGLNYRGSLVHYTRQSGMDSAENSLLLGITRQTSRHTTFTLRENVGMFSRNFLLPTLSQTVPFDPVSTYVPTTDFFDNRTVFMSSQVDFIYQKSARLSFDLGGDGFLARRRSTALAGLVGGSARGDVQYRLSRRTTIGALYNYSHFDYIRIFGGSDLSSLSAVYSIRLSRNLEFSGYGGFARVESKFLEQRPVDPVIAALLGVSSSGQIIHAIDTVPNVAARLSRTFSKGVIYASGGHSVTPGNGLFLTSYTTSVLGGYTYTGLRRWSFNIGAGYSGSNATGPIAGSYASYTANASASRQLGRGVHAVAQLNGRRYSSGNYENYNRTVYDLRIGLGFTPGEVPLRIW